MSTQLTELSLHHSHGWHHHRDREEHVPPLSKGGGDRRGQENLMILLA